MATPTPRQLGSCSDWNRRAYEIMISPSLREYKGRLGDYLPQLVHKILYLDNLCVPHPWIIQGGDGLL